MNPAGLHNAPTGAPINGLVALEPRRRSPPSVRRARCWKPPAQQLGAHVRVDPRRELRGVTERGQVAALDHVGLDVAAYRAVPPAGTISTSWAFGEPNSWDAVIVAFPE